MMRARCWNCDYPLHGLRGDRCPECGNGPKPPKPEPPSVDIAREIAGMIVFVHHAVYIYAAICGVGLLGVLLALLLSLMFV